MSRFGWAYVSTLLTGAVANGPTNSIQFNSGSQILSGSSNFTFDPATSTVYLTGTLRADTLIVSASQILKSGSTVFGDSAGDTHQFTGSVLLANSLTVTGLSTFNDRVAITTNGLVVTGSTFITGANFQVLGGTVSSSNALQTAGNLSVATNATIGGNILGSGGFKAAYNTYNSNYNVAASSYFNGISTSGGVVTASLDSATQYQAGQTLIFKDTGGAAGTNNILIKPSGSQTIDGASGGVRITTNSGSITLVSNGTNQFYIVASR